MIYEICYHGRSELDLIQTDSRQEVERILREQWESFQSFTVPEAGRIQVYAVELTRENKRAAAAYFDEECQFIWLHCE